MATPKVSASSGRIHCGRAWTSIAALVTLGCAGTVHTTSSTTPSAEEALALVPKPAMVALAIDVPDEYLEPQPVRLGFRATQVDPKSNRDKIAKLKSLLPVGLRHSLEQPNTFYGINTADLDDSAIPGYLLSIAIEYLNLELSVEQRLERYRVALKASAVLEKLILVILRKNREYPERGKAGLLQAELLRRLGDREAASTAALFGAGQSGPFRVLGLLMAGEIACERQDAPGANQLYWAAAQYGAGIPEGDEVLRHVGCGTARTVGQMIEAGFKGKLVRLELPAVPEPTEPAPKHVPRIWVVAVGISEYATKDLTLGFAAKDARAIDEFFASAAGTSVPKDRRTLLLDAAADRAAVLDALRVTAKRSAPDDLLIVYLAMHALPDSGGDLYFLTHDTVLARLTATALAQRDVEYMIGGAQAKNIVLLMDACHSGAAGLGFGKGKRGVVFAQTNRMLSRLADIRPGVALLAASSATEPSLEGARWAHGVFTHSVLAGLNGAADTDLDGLVSIRELYDFAYSAVAKATDGQQHPELKGAFDNRLPLAETKP